ncbi:MAG: phosphate acyltransferase PlsX [Mucinivorans sp.]
MRIGIDAMGGDFAPEVVVRGAIDALDAVGVDSQIVLYGNKELIEPLLPVGCAIEIVHTTQVISMSDHPAQAFQQKTDSSITRGFAHLAAGRIDGFASAGSTGAMMVGSMFLIKAIQGVARPTIATHFASTKGTPVTILDVGLNSDCKPEVLAQYAVMGSIYAQQVCGIANPRVALLNIGSEPTKGNLVSKATFPLLQALSSINFVGNVEGKHILDAQVADVIVCDGFMGNVLLKMLESIYDTLAPQGVDLPYINSMNYEITGGTPVLGINSTVVIGHGASSVLAIKNMILATEKAIRADLVNKFKSAFSA